MNPKTPEKAPKIKYKVPIFLWFVEKKSTNYSRICEKNQDLDTKD
jgi:glucan phosphoethanolaminetransferase (alkaline phosphatase superfamily)